MFEQSMVDAAPRTRRGMSVVVSFLFQCTALGALLIIPLFRPELLPKAAASVFLTAPAPPPPPPAPAVPQRMRPISPRTLSAAKTYMPTEVPKRVAMVIEEPVVGAPGPADPHIGVIGGLGDSTNIAAVPHFDAPKPPAPKPQPTEAKQAKQVERVRLTSTLAAAQLIQQIKPEYPPIAKQTRTQGKVVFRAVIARDGRIANLEFVSGPALLVPAATDAVRQWRYRPTMLNGEAVEVMTQIEVNFVLQ